MRRTASLLLLVLLVVQAVLPGRAMACAPGNGDGVESAAATAHAQHHGSSETLAAERPDHARSDREAPARPHQSGHCLMAVCAAPALAATAPPGSGATLPAAVLAHTPVMELHSATLAPDTPPPRG